MLTLVSLVAIKQADRLQPRKQRTPEVKPLQFAVSGLTVRLQQVDIDFINELYCRGTISLIVVENRFKQRIAFPVKEFPGHKSIMPQ